jgi:23S rRNA-/tRNA-specific pseudouridylate synthase
MPEVVFVLNIKNNEFEKMVNRIVDEKEILKDYEAKIADMRAEKQKEINERVAEMKENNEEEEEIENVKKSGLEELETEIAENNKWED